ncbi:MAG: serine/threonine-protein kinase [Planctomycetota bacterium]
MKSAQDSVCLVEVLDEYLNEWASGQAPELESFLARHPELAEDLRPCLTTLEFIHASPPKDDSALPRQALGDFEIRGELGRGGMGVVYEAEQISLNRHVALKVLPFAAVMDPRQLQRFKNEAQAAAHLHHTHIVPVYSIGCERGVHYYAMQYIEGPTVAEMIEQLKSTAGKDMRGSSASALEAITKGKSTQTAGYCRSVARLGIQAAEALDHAHQQGVIHRDIKPANLIVDAASHLWITDFGLASFTKNPGLTLTGDIVGTVRYMSPEQALAKRVPVDHRTDIYSLGVTLYEFLTLEGAYQGDDAHKVIQEIAFKDPQSARSFNPAIRNELETILMKAMAKSPEERYETAQELADDLERYLQNKPIEAKRPGVFTRASKWARRHGTFVGAAAAVLALATAGFATATTLIWREKELIRHEKKRSNSEHRRAQANVRLALDALDRIYMGRADGLPKVREDLSRDLLEEGLRFYVALASENLDDPEVAKRTGRAQLFASQIYAKLGQKEQAAEAQAKGIATIRTVIGREPDDAEAYFVLGYALYLKGQHDEAVAAFREAIRLEPDYAVSHANLGAALADKGEIDEAIAMYRKAIRLDPDQSQAHYNLGNALRDKGEINEAIAAFREAIRVDPDYVRAHYNLGNALRDKGEIDEAIAAFREAIRVDPDHALAHNNLGAALLDKGEIDEAIAACREAIRLQPDLALAPDNLGNALRDKGEIDEAIAAHREAIRLDSDNASAHNNLGNALLDNGGIDEAIAAYREAIRLQPDLALAHSNLGNALRVKGEIDEAIAACREAIRLEPDYASAHVSLGIALRNKGEIDEAIAAFREAIRLEPDHSRAHSNLGNALRDKGEIDEAISACREATRLQPDAAKAHVNLGAALADKGEIDEAIAAYREAIRLDPDLAPASRYLGRVLARKGKHAEAIAALREAIRLDPKNARTHHDLSVLLFAKGEVDDAISAVREAIRIDPDYALAHYGLGTVLMQRGQLNDAISALREAIRIDPDHVGAHVNLGNALAAQGRHAEAIAAYRDAIRVDPRQPQALNNLAMLRADCPEHKYRNAKEAVALATRAVSLAPHWQLLNTLGISHFRAGNWNDAVAALEKSMRLRKGGDSYDWFWLAMALWQLDRKEPARQWYERAVAWMDEHAPQDKDLIRFRNEAAKLVETD